MVAFTLFASTQKRVDGFVFDVAFAGVGQTVEMHARLVNKIMRFLRFRNHIATINIYALILSLWLHPHSDRDPSGFRTMNVVYACKRGWVFSFAGEEFFVTTFAPCYESDNARYMYGVTDRAFVLFQVRNLAFELENHQVMSE